jgi:murein L,D-transpeptidase YafK
LAGFLTSVGTGSIYKLKVKPDITVRSAEQLVSIVDAKYKKAAGAYPLHAILLRAFKKEAALELWAASAEKQPYILVHEYRICNSSGVLGPKRGFGDEQVPEGFYQLD